MRIRSAVEIEDPAAGAEPSNRERRIKAGYRRLLRAVMDGKAEGGTTEKLKSRKQKAEIGRDGKLQRPKTKIQRTSAWRPGAVDYLDRFLCAGFVLALLLTGCAGPRPLKGGRAVTTHKPAGVIEQTLVQGENPSQATKQDQETVKVRSYTVPAGSRMEQSAASAFHDPQYEQNGLLSISLSPSKGERVPKAGEGARQPSTLPPSPSGYGRRATEDGATRFTLSAPMPVVEREETRARTELGAAQKDTAREIPAASRRKELRIHHQAGRPANPQARTPAPHSNRRSPITDHQLPNWAP